MRFADKIQDVTDASAVPAWAPWRADKIRIAILDTGIDAKDDMLIETALQCHRIKECRGFVNYPGADPDPEDYHDEDGHGTHVARLVLTAAPSADVFIAKISNKTTMDARDLHRIARVGATHPGTPRKHAAK